VVLRVLLDQQEVRVQLGRKEALEHKEPQELKGQLVQLGHRVLRARKGTQVLKVTQVLRVSLGQLVQQECKDSLVHKVLLHRQHFKMYIQIGKVNILVQQYIQIMTVLHIVAMYMY